MKRLSGFFSDKRPDEKPKAIRFPESILAILFFVFIFLTGGYSLKNYWDIRVSGITETPDGFSLENAFQDNFNILLWNKDSYVEYYGLMASLLGQPELNQVIKLNNGYLSGVEAEVSKGQLEDDAADLIGLKDYLEDKGSRLLYVQAPFKIDKYDESLPPGVEDYSNRNLDYFLECLGKGRVDVIDIRQAIHEDGLNQYDYFFRTDHHWTPEGGFYAFKKISGYIEENYGIVVDEQVRDLGNYRVDNYEDWHLGSNGQRVGIRYGGIDDFHMISPEFDTQITNMDTQVSGSYYDVLIEDAVLKEKSVATYDIAYGNSIGGHFYNPNAQNDAKVIVVSDSMGKVVAPFLILSYREVYTTGYDLTKQALDEYDPDVVVYITYPANVSSGGCFHVLEN